MIFKRQYLILTLIRYYILMRKKQQKSTTEESVMTPWASVSFFSEGVSAGRFINEDFIGMFYGPIWFSKLLFGGAYLEGGAITDFYGI